MARQPEVFVRELDPAEAQRLMKITRTARDRVRLRRAGIVLASLQRRSAAEAAAMFAATAQYACGDDPRVQPAGVRGTGPKTERGPSGGVRECGVSASAASDSARREGGRVLAA